jgi:Protein of unknown function (DUF1207)
MAYQLNCLFRFCRQRIVWALYLFTFCFTVTVTASQTQNDALATDYLTLLLQQRLSLKPDEFQINVFNSQATITLLKADNRRVEKVKQSLSDVSDRFSLEITVVNQDKLSSQTKVIHYPKSSLFPPLIAATKEPRFFISFVQVKDKSNTADFLMGSVGLGQSFGLYRWPGKQAGNGWQLDFFGAGFSQFNMDASSDDLLNTDYLVGFPLTFRYGSLSGRMSLFHQSSHLGDELILGGTGPDRVNLSIEAFDILLAKDIGNWRFYGGGTTILRHNPDDLENKILQAGMDYRSVAPLFFGARVVGGVDAAWIEERNWETGVSIEFGLSFGHPYPYRRGTRLMFKAYKGVSPFGQFYTEDIEYYGLGWHIDI